MDLIRSRIQVILYINSINQRYYSLYIFLLLGTVSDISTPLVMEHTLTTMAPIVESIDTTVHEDNVDEPTDMTEPEGNVELRFKRAIETLNVDKPKLQSLIIGTKSLGAIIVLWAIILFITGFAVGSKFSRRRELNLSSNNGVRPFVVTD